MDMKKRMPKLMALVLTLALCFGSVQSVFAVNTYSGVSEDKAEEVTYTFHNDVVAGKYKLVNTETLKSWVDSNAPMVVVDTMPGPSSYNKGHVPGAINLVAGTGAGEAAYNLTPEQKKTLLAGVKEAVGTTKAPVWKKVSKSAYNKLSKANRKTGKVNGKTVYYKKAGTKTVVNKNYKVVVYCGFVGCARSHVAAKYLVDNGYTNVYRYGGGIQAWEDAQNEVEKYVYVSPKYVNSKLNDSNVVLLDVRKAEDYAKGHIEGSVSASTVSDALPEEAKPEDGKAADNIKAAVEKYGKDKEYILICYSGNRYANAAVPLLMNEGVAYENIKILGSEYNKRSGEGGMKAWTSAGYKTVTE